MNSGGDDGGDDEYGVDDVADGCCGDLVTTAEYHYRNGRLTSVDLEPIDLMMKLIGRMRNDWLMLARVAALERHHPINTGVFF